MSLSDFQILQKLGDGSYSSVYKVKRLEDGLEYALKKVKISHLSDREKENALNEVRILASIKHKNVASYKQAFFDEPSASLCIVMEYADNGDVFQKICQYQPSGNLFKEKVIWKIFIQTVRGLKALHDLKILHRDMKSANIFLYRDYTAKLGDLNVSKVAKKGLLYTQTGTPYYASPEVWKDQPYDCKSDIWSLGCVLYEMCSLVPPFRADDMNGLFKKVLKGAYPQIPSNYSMDLRSVIKSLLQVNPAQRPNTEQILDMSIIVRRVKKYFKDETMNNSVMTAQGGSYEAESELLKTIKFSKNLFKLKLPQPTYDSIQFATLPSQNFTTGKSYSRNLNGSVQTMSTTAADKSTSLPKIGGVSQSSRNNLSLLTHSTNKSQHHRVYNHQSSNQQILINNSSVSAIGEGEERNNEDENYEQDFEYDDRQQQYQQPANAGNYSAKNQQQQMKAPRNYSGRQAGPQGLNKNKAVIINNDNNNNNEYTDSHTSYALNTNRSKSTVSYNNQQENDNLTPSQKILQTQQKQQQLSQISDQQTLNIRNLNQSPSQSLLQPSQPSDFQINPIALPKSNKSKASTNRVSQQMTNEVTQAVAGNQHQATPIDEKAELDSQYEEDFEKEQTLPNRQKAKSLPPQARGAAAMKSGKKTSIVEPSVNASIQNQVEVSNHESRNPPRIIRDSSQGSTENLAVRESKNGAKNLQKQIIPYLSRSPSDQSLEKQEQMPVAPRSLQPSSLGKNVIIKPISTHAQPQPASHSVVQPAQPKKSPNMDRIVSIYSINSSSLKAKKKKYYLNLVNQNAQAAQGAAVSGGSLLNEDIRVKLRQLREGIGYYESKSSVNRIANPSSYHHNLSSIIDNQNSFLDNSSRNQNNSSVLLPELKNSLSPGNHHYASNHMGGKKPSVDRILKHAGIGGGNLITDPSAVNGNSGGSLNRIYNRKVFATPSQHNNHSMIYGGSAEKDFTGGVLRQQQAAVPLKIRPNGLGMINNNINVYRGGGGAIGINNSSELLDIQGKSVKNK